MRLGLAILGLVACSRDPVEAVCPDVAAGDLVVTEVRGPQTPDDLLGPWVEMFNASARTVELEGTRIRFRRMDGSSEIPVLIRRSLPIAAGDYAVLGLFFDDAERPAHIDYGFLDDYEGTWLAAAAIDVESCGARVDLAKYDALPEIGTYSLNGTPDAESNDLATEWCIDVTSTGTPGAANTACP